MKNKKEILISSVIDKINPKFLCKNRKKISDKSIFANLGSFYNDTSLKKILTAEAVYRISKIPENKINEFIEEYCPISPATMEVFLLAFDRLVYPNNIKFDYYLLVRDYVLGGIAMFGSILCSYRYGNTTARIQLLISKIDEKLNITPPIAFLRNKNCKPRNYPLPKNNKKIRTRNYILKIA